MLLLEYGEQHYGNNWRDWSLKSEKLSKTILRHANTTVIICNNITYAVQFVAEMFSVHERLYNEKYFWLVVYGDFFWKTKGA